MYYICAQYIHTRKIPLKKILNEYIWMNKNSQSMEAKKKRYSSSNYINNIKLQWKGTLLLVEVALIVATIIGLNPRVMKKHRDTV